MDDDRIVAETVKQLLLDNEELVVSAYSGLVRAARELDRDERIYFAGDGFTINLVPQTLLVLGWLARKLWPRATCACVYTCPCAVVGLLLYGLSDEYQAAQHSYDEYPQYPHLPEVSGYSAPHMSAHYLPPHPPAPAAYSAYIAPRHSLIKPS